jgi:two-component system OmpR family response regulator
MRILIVEDDIETADYIVKGLKQSGHAVDHAATGRQGLLLAANEPFDVMVIDRMLPGIDGLKLVESLRKDGVKAPVLFLTALGGIDDRVEGLEAGADDYLVKPFAFTELLARLNALARRPPLERTAGLMRVGDLEMDIVGHEVTRGGKKVDLQPREFRLLEYLMRNAGRVVTRTMLLQNVWEFNFDPKTKIVETHISRLRAKIDRRVDQQLVHTVRGSGYVLREPS